MNDAQLLRYSRHILLDGLGIEAQTRFLGASVLLVGAGGLGSAAALYLGASGVGRLVVVDDDRVDLTNLQRQIAHGTDRIGTPKASSIATTVAALNPDVVVDAHMLRATPERLTEWVAASDVVVDCCDNFVTRHAINAACVAAAVPLVSGAAIGFDGQLAVYDVRRLESPCYACVFPPAVDGHSGVEEARCATMGVFAPLVGIIGSAQAAEALKLVAAVGTSLAGRLQLLDARSMDWTTLRTPRNPACPVCAHRS